ncbi:MAG: AAA family ATPase [Gammaproteobacteria bacterium]|nr:AAA family ATPase [Gammaproteobacteria bacterium]
MIEDLRGCVPHELRDLKAWVLFRLVPKPEKPGKFDKVPHYSTGERRHGTAGSPNDIESLTDFATALAVLEGPRGAGFDGLGLAVLPCHDFLALDLDDVAEPERQDFAELVRTCGAYVETSPSGNGLRAFFRGKAGLGNRKVHARGVELFESSGFVTVTGAEVSDGADLVPMPPAIRVRLEAILGDGKVKATSIGQAPAVVDRPKVSEFLERRLAAGFPDDCRDRSAFLYGLALRLRRASLTDAQSLAILADPAGPWAVPGLERRCGDVASAREWTWRYVVAPAYAAKMDEGHEADASIGEPPPRDPDDPGFAPSDDRKQRGSAGDGGDKQVVEPAGGNRDDQDAPRIIAGPERSRVRADLFDSPPGPPRMIVEGYEPQDAGHMTGAGGTGKTTLELVAAVHTVLGWSLFGELAVLQPGPVLFVSAEDGRERIEYRLHRICEAYNLGAELRRRVLDAIHIEDLSATRARLVQADAYGNLTRTPLADEIARAYRGRGLVRVVFDPVVFFGPGERFVNDGEAEVMHAGRFLAAALACCVKFLAHVGKANARSNSTDQYSGRGGSALADNSRFVHVLTPHGSDAKDTPPAAVTAQDIAEGRILRLNIAKLTDARRPEYPLWLRRDGWRFDLLPVAAFDPEVVRAERLRALGDFVRQELAADIKHSVRSLEDAAARLPFKPKRAELRDLVHAAIESGVLILAELPNSERHGRRTTYLQPIGGPRP